MAPKELLQDTVEYNRRLNLSRKMLKSKKCPLPALPLGLVGPLQPHVSASVPAESGKVVGRSLWAQRRRASRNSLQSGVSVRVSVESDRVVEGRAVPSNASNRILMSKTPQKTKNMCNYVLYTPVAELKHNYETVLSWLQTVSIQAATGNIEQRSRQVAPAPGSSGLPRARYRVSSAFIDELLAGINARALERHQPSSEVKALVDDLLDF